MIVLRFRVAVVVGFMMEARFGPSLFLAMITDSKGISSGFIIYTAESLWEDRSLVLVEGKCR